MSVFHLNHIYSTCTTAASIFVEGHHECSQSLKQEKTRKKYVKVSWKSFKIYELHIWSSILFSTFFSKINRFSKNIFIARRKSGICYKVCMGLSVILFPYLLLCIFSDYRYGIQHKKNTLIIAVHITLWIHRLNLRYLTIFWNLRISFTKKSYQNLTRLRQRVTWRNQNILIMWVVGMRFGFLHSTPHKPPGTKKSALLKNISNLPPLMDRTSPIVSIRWNAPYFLPVLLMILWMQFMVLKVFCSHPKDGRLKDFSKHGPIMSIILTGHISANNYMFDCFGYHRVSG